MRFVTPELKDLRFADALGLASELGPLEMSPSWTRRLVSCFSVFFPFLFLHFLCLIMVLLDNVLTVCLTFAFTGYAQFAWTWSSGNPSLICDSLYSMRSIIVYLLVSHCFSIGYSDHDGRGFFSLEQYFSTGLSCSIISAGIFTVSDIHVYMFKIWLQNVY